MGFENESTITSKNDVLKISKALPSSKIIALHLEAINATVVTRDDLLNFSDKNGLKNVLIPNDGEIIKF